MDDVEIVRQLTDDESNILETLRARIFKKRRINKLRGAYHDGKKELDKIGFSVPPHMTSFQTPIGWPEKAVTVPASRVRPDGFTLRVESSLMDDLDTLTADGFHEALERRWVRSAMQTGIAFAFATKSQENPDEVVRVVRPATQASAEINPRTWEVTAALEVISRAESILYLPGYAVGVRLIAGTWQVTDEYDGIDGIVPCTPLPWEATTEHPYGRSRITRPLMGFTDVGMRTMLRQEVTSEFFSAPQRSLMGADEVHFTNAKGERISPLEALIGGIWALPDVWDDDEGKLVRPELQQLSQASMQPHSDMLRSIGCMVSSETTIPLGYLGIIHDQPSSADAILASESDMVAMIEAELPAVAAARADFARKCLSVLHGEWTPEMRSDLRTLRGRHRDAGTPTLSATADAGQKFVQTFPDADPEVAMERYGLPTDQIERMLAYKRRAQGTALVEGLINANTSTSGSAQDQPTAVDSTGGESLGGTVEAAGQRPAKGTPAA